MDESAHTASIDPMLVLIAVAVLVGIFVALTLRRRRSENVTLENEKPQLPRRGSPSAGNASELMALVNEGELIHAIKLVRERTGMGLKEAKEYVEAVRAGRLADLPAEQPVDATSTKLDSAEVLRLMAQGDTIAAIKLVRERTGHGLKEAKDYVEALALDRAPSLPPARPSVEPGDLDTEVQRLVAKGNVIKAVKLVRERTGLGLKEAKDYVDRLR
jgi:ribosomal protein L7/L12